MEKITEMKINKDGSATVYVPKDQIKPLMWILTEGQAGIWDEEDVNEITGDDDPDTPGWRGWQWGPR